MAVIVTESNCLHIDGALIPKNTHKVAPLANGIRLSAVSGSSYLDIPVSGTTIDGESVESVDQLKDFFKEQGFSDGGGAPSEGVQSIQAGDGVSVDDTDPANPVVSATGGSFTAGQISESGTGQVNQIITFDTGNSELNNGIVSPSNESAVVSGMESYSIENGVITITTVATTTSDNLIYNYIAMQ